MPSALLWMSLMDLNNLPLMKDLNLMNGMMKLKICSPPELVNSNPSRTPTKVSTMLLSLTENSLKLKSLILKTILTGSLTDSLKSPLTSKNYTMKDVMPPLSSSPDAEKSWNLSPPSICSEENSPPGKPLECLFLSLKSKR
jgi:hypothetical protein